MNCLKFRHHLLTTPLTESAEFVQHLASCPKCANEATRARQFEAQLLTAVSIEAPEGLQARILLAQTHDKPQPARLLRPQWLAMVASLLIAVGITAWLGYDRGNSPDQPLDLKASVLDHINSEIDHLHENRNLQQEQIAGLLDPLGIKMEKGLGRVNYAGRCTIRRHSGIHLVIPGQQGPVTILLMPDEYVKDSLVLRSSRFSGVIVPTDYGSMAVIGEQGEALDEIIAKVSRMVARDI